MRISRLASASAVAVVVVAAEAAAAAAAVAVAASVGQEVECWMNATMSDGENLA